MYSRNMVFYSGVALTIWLCAPAFGQGDPVPGPTPVQPTRVETPVPQQPSFLQTLQQQQLNQQILNNIQFPSYLQANPTVTPLDQRSGLVPQSIDIKILQPFGLTTTIKIPVITNATLLAPTKTQVTTVAPQTTSSINSKPSFSSLDTLFNNLANLQNTTTTTNKTTTTNVTTTSATPTTTTTNTTPTTTQKPATTITILDTSTIKGFNQPVTTTVPTTTPTTTTKPTTTVTETKPATTTQTTPATTTTATTTSKTTNTTPTTTTISTPQAPTTLLELARTPLSGTYLQTAIQAAQIQVTITSKMPALDALKTQLAAANADIKSSKQISKSQLDKVDELTSKIETANNEIQKMKADIQGLEAKAKSLQDAANKPTTTTTAQTTSRALPGPITILAPGVAKAVNDSITSLNTQLAKIDFLASQIELVAPRGVTTTEVMQKTVNGLKTELAAVTAAVKLSNFLMSTQGGETQSLVMNGLKQSNNYEFFLKVLNTPSTF